MPIFKALKLLVTNFYMTYKLILYYLVCFLILFLGYELLIVPTFAPILWQINDQEFFQTIGEAIRKYIAYDASISDTISKLNVKVQAITFYLNSNAGTVFKFVLAIIFYVAIAKFLFSFKDIALCEYLENKLSYKMNTSFVSLMIKNLKKSCIYSAIKVAQSLLFYIIIIPILIFCSTFFLESMGVFGLFFILFILLAINAYSFSVFAFCLPEASKSKDILFGYGRGIKLSVQHFTKIIGLSFALMLLIYFVNTVIAFFTFGVGLIISLPLSILTMSIFKIVLYYSALNKPFYVTPSEVAKINLEENPLEAKIENFQEIKDENDEQPS